MTDQKTLIFNRTETSLLDLLGNIAGVLDSEQFAKMEPGDSLVADFPDGTYISVRIATASGTLRLMVTTGPPAMDDHFYETFNRRVVSEEAGAPVGPTGAAMMPKPPSS